MESVPLSLVVHQKIVEGGGRLGEGAAAVVVARPAADAAAATAAGADGEAEGGLQAGVEGVAVERGARHEGGALRPEGNRGGESVGSRI